MNYEKVVVVKEPEETEYLSRFSFISVGKFVFATHTIPVREFNQWVVKIADESGQDMVWFHLGPMYVIGVVGDVEIVKEVITRNRPEHDQLYIGAIQRKYGKTPEKHEIPGQFID